MKKLLGVIAALAAGVSGSQLPEFSQQYRQRLGGAIQELEHVVVRFEQDATSVGMTVESALNELETSSHELFHRRGVSMRSHVTRYQTLKHQQEAFEQLDPILRPMALMQGSDRAMLEATWEAFEPAVPLTAAGGAWATASAVLGFFALFLPAKLTGLLFRRQSKPIHPSKLNRARKL